MMPDLTLFKRPLVLLAIAAGGVLMLRVGDVVTAVSSSLVSPALAADEKDDQAMAEKSDTDMATKDGNPGGETDAVLIEAPATPDLVDPAMMSQSELALLRDLGKRRSDLDARERDIELRARLLEAAEKRVEAKIEDLKALEQKVAALLVEHEGQENQKIDSVVKVYEKMKPADAARILEGLSMQIQLDVAMRMSELRMAPILSKMKPKAAQALTTQLATKQVLDLGGNVN